MAKVYLDSGDNFTLSSAATVYGSTGTEKVVVNSGVTGITIDASVERVDLSGASSAYTFKQAGNTIQVYSGATLVATTTVQDDTNGSQLVFSNGSVDVKMATGGTMTLGGATVSSTAAGAVTPTTIDASTTSGSGTGGTGGTGQTFVLTASDVTITEPAQVTAGTNTSANMTFTVNLSAAQTTDTVVNYATSTATGDLAVANSDYTTTNGSVTIAKGATSATFTVPVIGDGVFDGTVANPTAKETFTVTLSSPTAAFATSTVKGNITDLQTNSLPVNTVPATTPQVVLGTNAAVKTISVADANNNTVTVELTASNGLMNLTGAGTVATVTGKATTTLTGSVADINTALATLTYASDRTIAGSDTITIKTTDGFGGVDTDVVTVNVIAGALFKNGVSDALTGTTGNDVFIGVGGGHDTAASITFVDTADTASGSDGTDKVVLTEVQAGDLDNATAFTSIEELDITTETASGADVETIVIAVNAIGGNTLKTISHTDGSTTKDDSVAITGALTGTTLTLNSSVTAASVVAATAASTVDVILAGGVTVAALNDKATINTTTLNITSNGTTKNTITALGGATGASITDEGTVNLKGNTELSVTLAGTNNKVLLIDGSTAGGKLTVNAAVNAAAGTLQIKGGTVGDVLTGDSDAASKLYGNAGNDTLTGGTGADTIEGGAGDDSITGGAGADSINGGTGKDTIVADASDTLYFIAGDTGSTTATRDSVSGIIEGTKINLTGYATDFSTTFGLAAAATLATSASSATTREIYLDQTKQAIVIEMDAAGTTTEEIYVGVAFKATVSHTAGVLTFGAVPLTASVSGSYVMVEGQNATGAAVVADLSKSIPQVGGTNVTGATSSYVNLDASKMAGSNGLTITGSTVSNILIGTSLADTFEGKVGADTITTGTGADTVKFTTGDSLVGTIGDSNKSMTVANSDVVYVSATDIIDITAAAVTVADYDNLAQVAAGNDISFTITAKNIAEFVGTYDTATGKFLSTATNAATSASTTDADAIMIAWAATDAGTTATQAVVLVGVGTQLDAAMVNGVFTLA